MSDNGAVPDVELVVTDLDGTFWCRIDDDYEQAHPTSLDAWRALEGRGVPVLVATGRRLRSTRAPLARLGLAPPVVVLNGALVVDLPAGGTRVHRHAYADASEAAAVLEAFRAVGLDPCVYVDHDELDVFHGEHPSTAAGHLATFGDEAACADLDAVVAEHPVFMFGVMGHDPGPFDALVEMLGDTSEVHVSSDQQWGGWSCTVGPRGLSKWDGVVAYCRHAGLDPDRVLAIGDGPNDVELLTRAAIAVAPSCGQASARAVADHVVRPVRDGGWADLLDLV